MVPCTIPARPEQDGQQARVAHLVNDRTTTFTGWEVLQELHAEVTENHVPRVLDFMFDRQQSRVALPLVAVDTDDGDDCPVTCIPVPDFHDGHVEHASDTIEQGQEN